MTSRSKKPTAITVQCVSADEVGTQSRENSHFSRNFVRVFFSLYFVLGLGMIGLTPPFQSPDAFAHFDRAFGISQGQLITTTARGVPGDTFPVGVIQMEDIFSAMAEGRSVTATKYEYVYGWHQTWNMPLYFTNFDTGGNIPFLYLPQSLGIVVGRIFSSHLLVGYYLAEILNLLTFVVLTKWALSRFPRRLAFPLGVFLLLPMVNSLAISINPDCLLLALSMVFAASIYSGYSESRKSESRPPLVDDGKPRVHLRHVLTNANYQIGFVSLLLMALEKPPLLLLGLLLPLADLHSNLRRYFRRALLFMVSAAVTYEVWTKFGAGPQGKPVPLIGVSPARQLTLVLTNPLKDVDVLIQTFRTYGLLDWKEFIAGIGWLDTWFPSWFYVFASIVFVLALLSAVSIGRRHVGRTIWSLSVWALVAVVLMFTFYLVDSQYSLPTIIGLQGRYFLPLVPTLVVLLGLESTRSPRFRTLASTVEEFAGISLICLQAWMGTAFAMTVLHRYWL